MKYIMLLAPVSDKDVVVEMVKNLQVNKSIPIYYRYICTNKLYPKPRNKYDHYYQFALSGVTEHQMNCMEGLGYNMVTYHISRKQIKKYYRKIKTLV